MNRDEAESSYSPKYLELATGEVDRGDMGALRLPVRLKGMGHSNASYQSYAAISAPYFHHGVDLRAEAGSPVIAARGGQVVAISNYFPGPLYWEIAILDTEGFLWQYHHVLRESMPAEIIDAYNRRTAIPDGARLGTVYPWPQNAFGERYNHVHVNVIGAGKVYLNPLRFLEPIADKIEPEIKEAGLLQNGRKVAGTVVSGPYSLYAHIEDHVWDDPYVIPPHLVSVQIDGGAPEVVWSFDELPGGASTTAYVDKFYVPGEVCGNYECRRPVIDLGFDLAGRHRFPQTRGKHRADILARDFEGNTVVNYFEWEVR